jgi:DNA-binding CsgD family transcriptional regulator
VTLDGWFSVSALPVRPQAAQLRGLPEGAVAMLVFFAEGSECVRARLARRHGLTQTEIDVTLALVAGLSALQIGERRSIGLATVRTHLKRIFMKLGVRRQAEVVLLVSRLVNDLMPRPDVSGAAPATRDDPVRAAGAGTPR